MFNAYSSRFKIVLFSFGYSIKMKLAVLPYNEDCPYRDETKYLICMSETWVIPIFNSEKMEERD